MITGINHITLAVRDLERAFEFYTDILGLAPVVRWNHGAYLTAADTWLALNLDPGVSETKRSDSSHIAFSCSGSEFELLRCRLRELGCEEWSQSKSEGDSFYFLDPDGHKLEIHAGDLRSRLRDMRGRPQDSCEFFG